jgi:hypothetical protein
LEVPPGGFTPAWGAEQPARKASPASETIVLEQQTMSIPAGHLTLELTRAAPMTFSMKHQRHRGVE